MSRRAVILSAVPVSTALCRYVQPGDFVVACDAGYRNAERLDLRPDLIVAYFAAQGLEVSLPFPDGGSADRRLHPRRVLPAGKRRADRGLSARRQQ